MKKSKVLKDASETTYGITKLIKISPRREAIFLAVKQDMPGSSSAGIRLLCLTRWTVRADALASVTSNFQVLQQTWEESIEAVCDTETKPRIRGISNVMSTLDYLYGNVLGEMLLKHADYFSRSLQTRTLSAAEGQQIAKMTIQTLKSLRTDSSFDLFWSKIRKKAADLDVDEPQLPRRRRIPPRFDEGTSEGDYHSDVKAYYRLSYYEAIDLIVNCIENRFNKPGYKT